MHTHNLIGLVEMFTNDNYLDKAWDRELKRAIINIKDLMNSHTLHTHTHIRTCTRTTHTQPHKKTGELVFGKGSFSSE